MDLKTKILVRIAELSQKTSVIRVPLSLTVQKGCKIEYPADFHIRKSPLGKGMLQYVGFHDCMIMTFSRPVICNNIVQMARILPEVPGFGYITWVGAVNHKAKRTVKKRGVVTYSNIPQRVWSHFSSSGTEKLKTFGFIHNMSVEYRYGHGKIPYNFIVMEIPALTREGMGIDNINFTWNETGIK